MNKSELMSKQEEDDNNRIGESAERRESYNNGSELMLNNNSTADGEHSQNPHGADSGQAISVGRNQPQQETGEIGGDSLIKNDVKNLNESFH